MDVSYPGSSGPVAAVRILVLRYVKHGDSATSTQRRSPALHPVSCGSGLHLGGIDIDALHGSLSTFG